MKTSLEKAIEIIHRLTKPQDEVIVLPPSKDNWPKSLLTHINEAAEAREKHSDFGCPYKKDAEKWRKQPVAKKEYMKKQREKK